MSQGGSFGSGGSGGSGISTINGISPDGSGNFEITSNDGSVIITPDANGFDLSVPGSGGGLTAFSAVMQNSQSIAQNALVNVVYDTVLVDTASGFSGGVYTIPTTGNWLFGVSAVFGSTAGFTACDIFINRNSGTFLVHSQPCVSISDPLAVTVNAGGMFPLTAGDTVKISVFGLTTGGTNFNCSGFANGYYNTFTGTLIS